MLKNLVFVIKVTQDFICHTEKEIRNNTIALTKLYDLVSNVYIPFLNIFEKFEKENLNCKVGFVIPPVFCNMLSDPIIQDDYLEYLQKRIDFGANELKRNQDEKIQQIIKDSIKRYSDLKSDFVEKYNKNIISSFAYYQKKGYAEILATCGTDLFVPHYSEMKEIISAQIECGLHSYKQFFGEVPEGFWLPEMGYVPGVEKLIKAYGFTYTILDTRSILFSQEIPSSGIFYPLRTANSLVVFARDFKTHEEIFEQDGLSLAEVYRNENKDVGFELEFDQLNPVVEKDGVRIPTGYKYWNKRYNDKENSLYDVASANAQAEKDVETFLKIKSEKLKKASELLSDKDFVCLFEIFDAYEISQNWYEAPLWFENVIRKAGNFGLNIATGDSMLENQYNLEKITPYYAALTGHGYGENLLSNKNNWMVRYIHKMSERMIDLADRFPIDTGLKNRLLNLGAKELMMGQSLGLARMIEEGDNPDFAERRFKECVKNFTQIFDSLGSNTVSTEWLTELEAKDSIFPWMNYRIFSRKL